MNCQVCLESFDCVEHKPFALTPCGHSFCSSCLSSLAEQHCPKCRRRIAEKIPNYAIMDVLDMKIFSLTKQNDKTLIRRSVNNYGYIEWKLEDKSKIIAKLIDDLKPKTALTFLANLPAYVVLMCIRYSDLFNHEDRVKSLVNSVLQAIKRLIKRKQEDVDYIVLWISNLARLNNCMKQYSGNPEFQILNTPTQNEQSLKNLVLVEFYDLIDDTINQLCASLIKQFENKLSSIIVPALLEYDYTAKVTAKTMVNIDTLIDALNDYLNLLVSHSIDSNIVEQIFGHLFFYINAVAFNTLLFRIEMCNWSKGISLSYNVSVLEEWQTDKNLKESFGSLDHLKQTSQLLAARKSDMDIQNLCDKCSKLSLAQIENILVLYTPVEFYERHIKNEFVEKFLNTLKETRQISNLDHKLLTVDFKKEISIRSEFNASAVCLELIEIPEEFGLNFLIKF